LIIISLNIFIFKKKLQNKKANRIKYNQLNYDHVFNDHESIETLNQSIKEPSLLKLIDAWLSRTPGLVSYDVNESGNKVEYNYMCKEYEKSVKRFLMDTYMKPAEVSATLISPFKYII
jgi:tryptophan 2,3-dioxygenase